MIASSLHSGVCKENTFIPAFEYCGELQALRKVKEQHLGAVIAKSFLLKTKICDQDTIYQLSHSNYVYPFVACFCKGTKHFLAWI